MKKGHQRPGVKIVDQIFEPAVAWWFFVVTNRVEIGQLSIKTSELVRLNEVSKLAHFIGKIADAISLFPNNICALYSLCLWPLCELEPQKSKSFVLSLSDLYWQRHFQNNYSVITSYMMWTGKLVIPPRPGEGWTQIVFEVAEQKSVLTLIGTTVIDNYFKTNFSVKPGIVHY